MTEIEANPFDDRFQTKLEITYFYLQELLSKLKYLNNIDEKFFQLLHTPIGVIFKNNQVFQEVKYDTFLDCLKEKKLPILKEFLNSLSNANR